MRFTLSLAALLTLITGCLPPLPPATVNFGPVDDTGEDTAVDETGDTAETAETGDSADSDSDSAVETGDTEVFEILDFSVPSDCGEAVCQFVLTTSYASAYNELDMTVTDPNSSWYGYHEYHTKFSPGEQNPDGYTYRISLSAVSTPLGQDTAESGDNPNTFFADTAMTLVFRANAARADDASYPVDCAVSGANPEYYADWCVS